MFFSHKCCPHCLLIFITICIKWDEMNIIHDKNKFIPYKLLYSLSDVKVASEILNNLLKCYCLVACFIGGDIGQAAVISKHKMLNMICTGYARMYNRIQG